MNYKKAIFRGLLISAGLFSSGFDQCYAWQEQVEKKPTLLEKAHMLQMRSAIQHADLKAIDAETFKKFPYEIKLEFLGTLQKKIGKLDPGNFSFYLPVLWKLLLMELKAIIVLKMKDWWYPQGGQAQSFHEISDFGVYGLYLLLVVLLVPEFTELMSIVSKRAEIYQYENYDVRAAWIKEYEKCLAIKELLQKADPDLFLQIQEQ